MNIKDLRYFVAVQETGGFSSASLLLGTVPSNVSGRIGRLEHFLGVVLFERQYRRIVPTRSAHEFYPHAKQAVQTFDRAKRVMSGKDRS